MSAPAPRFKNLIDARNWERIRDAWLEHVPTFPSPGAHPDPGVERLLALQTIELPPVRDRFPDVVGLRRQVLWESVFLFHKCAHAHLAVQRLGARGMHSWAMFNAYHAAYLGARSVLSLFGIAVPALAQGGQLFIDLHATPEKSRGPRAPLRDAGGFLLVRLPRFEQTHLWECFVRVLRVTDAARPLKGIPVQGLTDLDPKGISPPRNKYLYHADYWPMAGDLLFDGDGVQFDGLLGAALDPEEMGFLLRLSCDVYLVCEALLRDLAEISAPIRAELEQSRLVLTPLAPELAHHNAYVTRLEASAQAPF